MRNKGMKNESVILTMPNGMGFQHRLLQANDGDRLGDFLESLSFETRGKWRPHGYNNEAAHHVCNNLETDEALRLVSIIGVGDKTEIITYSILCDICKDMQARYQSYGLVILPQTTCQFAPCVADRFQNLGLGSKLMPHTIKIVRSLGYHQIILLGGVYVSNKQAVGFYVKHGFQVVGTFDPGQNKGDRHDMSLSVAK